MVNHNHCGEEGNSETATTERVNWQENKQEKDYTSFFKTHKKKVFVRPSNFCPFITPFPTKNLLVI